MELRIPLSRIIAKLKRSRYRNHTRTVNSSMADATDTGMIEAHVEQQDGKAVAHPVDPRHQGASLFVRRLRPAHRRLLALIVAIPLVIAGWLLIDNIRTARAASQFVVLVAPFTDAGDMQTGRKVATQLTALLQEYTADHPHMVIRSIRTTPTDETMAFQMATRQGADLLIWGSVSAGGLPDAPTLQPRLTYAPVGSYGPHVWAGYTGRFRMPHTYTLANEGTLLNGQAVLPRLLVALADYSQGNADQAYTALSGLLDDYPLELNPTFPDVIRGNILWARGAYDQAAAAYRRALEQPTGVVAAERALLYNNLGAILLDADNELAASVLYEAARQIQQTSPENDLGELRFNLGLLAQQHNQPNQAIESFEPARSLLPANTPLLLALSQAYREAGRLEEAQTTLAQAERQIRRDLRSVPVNQRSLLSQFLRAAYQEQRALLHIARQINAYGPLTWELESISPQPPTALNAAQDYMQNAVALSTDTLADWRSRAAATTAAGNGLGLVANGQAERIEQYLTRQQFYQALLILEEGRTRQNESHNLFSGIHAALFGSRTRFEEGQALLQSLYASKPNNVPVLLAYARSLRLANNYDEAQVAQIYDTVIERTPQRPEGYYGRGWLELDRRADSLEGRTIARQWMEQALERDPTFFPARFKLVDIAKLDGDLEQVLAQLRILAEQRPDDALVHFHIAETLLQQDDLSAAQTTYTYALKLKDDFPEAWFGLARTQYLLDQHDPEALRSIDRAIALRPQYAEAMLFKGQMLQAMGHHDAADAQFQSAIDAGLRDFQVLYTIGERLLEHDKAPQAVVAFKTALEEQPGNPWLHHGLGRAFLALNNLDRARTELQTALNAINESNPELHQLRASVLIDLGHVEWRTPYVDPLQRNNALERAFAYYQQALSLDATRVDAVIGLGEIAASRGNWNVALTHFEHARNLSTHQENALVHFWIAEALLRQPEFDPIHSADTYRQFMERAIAEYQQALALRPEFPPALLGQAHAQLALGQRAAAARSIETALRIQPQYAEALLFKGKLEQEAGNENAALAAYNAAIDANNTIAETFYRRAVLLMQRLEYEAAAQDLQRAIALQPNFSEAFYWLGHTYMAQNQMERARDAFRSAVQSRAGDYTAARFYQGLAEEHLNLYDEAVASFEAVIQANDAGEFSMQARTELERIRLSIARSQIRGLY